VCVRCVTCVSVCVMCSWCARYSGSVARERLAITSSNKNPIVKHSQNEEGIKLVCGRVC